MHTSYFRKKTTFLTFCIVCLLSTAFGQSPAGSAIDLQKERRLIDSLDKQFSRHFLNGDSLAIYNMYAKNASLGTLKGNGILLAWGRMIRNSMNDNGRNIVYTTASLSTDSEFLAELGKYERRDMSGNIKESGKYLVVWKKEGGEWKLYRDIGL